MLALDDPQSTLSALDALWYIAGAVAAIILGALGYNRKPSVQQAPGVSVAGAIVDNAALQPLFQRLDALIAELSKLTSALERDVRLRQAEVEEETQQRRIDEAVRKTVELLMHQPPAEMPPIRRRD